MIENMKTLDAAPGGLMKASYRLARNPRQEHRQEQRRRVEESALLNARFPQLKGLKVNLEFFDRDGGIRTKEMTYHINVEHARSVLLFACANGECIGGDFDLTRDLAGAIKSRQRTVTGQVNCRGTRKKASKESVPCRSILRYTRNLAYRK